MVFQLFAVAMAVLFSAPNEPDMSNMPPAVFHAALSANTARLPVAMTWYTPGCRGVTPYLESVNILVLDAYPFFEVDRDDAAILRHLTPSFRRCAAVARAHHIQFWINLQAFGPGVRSSSPLDRWRCPSLVTFRKAIALAENARPNRILFYAEGTVCPKLVPLIDRLTRGRARNREDRL